jgi:hypothetical protein
MDKRTERTQVSKEKLLEALEVSLGIVTDACEVTGLSRTQHYKWYKEDEEYRKAVDSIDNKFIDFAETHLKEQIKIMGEAQVKKAIKEEKNATNG